MEAVPRMPMIWLDLKEAAEFQFGPSVKQRAVHRSVPNYCVLHSMLGAVDNRVSEEGMKVSCTHFQCSAGAFSYLRDHFSHDFSVDMSHQIINLNINLMLFILKNYGEDPENYNEQLKKLEQLRQGAVNVTRDFEGCSTLRKYFGQLHYLQSRVPMGSGQEAAVPITWTEIFSGKMVTHDDISYEQACILYNLGVLHSMLGAVDNRVSEEGMKVSCTHFQCSAGAFSYLRDHFSHDFSVDMSHQIINLNINLMLGQAQECLLEKSMLDNRKSFLVARISAQVVDYYKEACRAMENLETASLLGKIQKDWKKLVQIKIYYFAAIAHVGDLQLCCEERQLHMGKQAEEQQKYGEQAGTEIYCKHSYCIQDKFNSAKKDNDFIYHESVPALETLPSVKGAPLVKALPVNPTDPSVTGPDLFSKLVPMAAHEASSLYSEEKAKLLRDVMAKINSKNETLEQFMDSLRLDPETVDNLDMYSHIPPVLMEKCAALSVRPDTVKNLIQSMQVLSGVFTDVEASLREIRELLEEEQAQERRLEEAVGKQAMPPLPPALAELTKDLDKYMEVHEKASFTNTELHRAMNLHIANLRLLGGPLESLSAALPSPELTEEDAAVLQSMKRILGKVQEMRDQRQSLEKQLRDLIHKDDITSALVTTERSEMKKLFEEQLKKYEQVKVYIDQNLAAQENILKALTEANVQYASVRKGLAETEHKWNTTVQTLVSSYEAYEDLMKKSQEGKEFYDDLEGKASRLLERARSTCQAREQERQQSLDSIDLEGKASRLLERARSTCQAREQERQQSLDRLTFAQGHRSKGKLKKKIISELGVSESPQVACNSPPHIFPHQTSQTVPPQQAQLLLPHPSIVQPLPPVSSTAPAVGTMPYPPAPLQHQGPLAPHLLPHSPATQIPQQPPPNAISPSPAPSPSPQPSPGPPSLGLPPPRPPPSLTPSLPAASSSPAPSSSSEVLFQRPSSTTDDLLSSSPESQHGGPKAAAAVLLPTKADPQDGQRKKKPEGVRLIEGDPYQAPELVTRLWAELERFRAVVEALEKPGQGPSELDARWKELQDLQEKDARQLSIAIARCYSMKNRHQDIMPYDRNRVVLQSGKDDYINASTVEELSPYCPRIIATQAPLTGTATDFWLMIYEQKVSLIVMLVSEQELKKQKVIQYFPLERGQQVSQGPITLTLTTLKVTPTHIERMIGLQYRDQSLKRTVIHLQFTSWPELSLPDSNNNLIRFIQEVHGHYLHQRPLHTPIVVHCSSGVGRTGAFCLLYAAMQEVEAGNAIPDLPLLVRKMRQQRKNMLQEKLHLKFCYETVLKHAEQVLQRHGVSTAPCSKTTNSAAMKPYSRQESQDIVLGGDMPISSIQATIAKMSIRPPSSCGQSLDFSDLDSLPPAQASLPAFPVIPLQPDLAVPAQSCQTAVTTTPPDSCSATPPPAESEGHVNSNTTEHPQPEPDLVPAPAPVSSSSLDLLASLTPEAFTLDAASKGKQRINKHCFLQPQNGQGLQGASSGDDPLSSLDPLWTLNKT
ncbi:UNVERIFIED_CONTAM: hypothetical protein FKN15_059704 [Acipenser sinensis]